MEWCITFFSNDGRVPLPFQESRVVNRENTYNLVTSPLIQIELKSFPGIVGRYLLVSFDMAFYKTWLVPPCLRMLCDMWHFPKKMFLPSQIILYFQQKFVFQVG
jgi:hypothetical protein